MENFFLDASLASVFLIAGGFFGFRISRAWSLSPFPVLALLPVFTITGHFLYAPTSPFYTRSDGEFYKSWGYSLADSWINGTQPLIETIWPGKGFWPLIIGLITAIVGPVTLTLIVLNALIVVLAAVALQKATLLLSGWDPKWVMTVVFLSSPPFLLFGPSLLREAIFWLGVSLGVLALAFVTQQSNIRALVFASVSSLLLLAIRPDAGLVFAYSIVAAGVFLYGFTAYPVRRSKAMISGLLLLALAASFPLMFDAMRPGTDAAFIEGAASELSGPGVTTAFDAIALDNVSEDISNQGFISEWLQSACPSSVGTAIICNAVRYMPQAFLGPFPWEYGPEPIWIISGVSTLHFLIVLSFSLSLFFTRSDLRWATAVMLSVAMISMVMFSSILANYGILIRFRAATEVVLIPLALVGYKVLVDKIKQRLTRV